MALDLNAAFVGCLNHPVLRLPMKAVTKAATNTVLLDTFCIYVLLFFALKFS